MRANLGSIMLTFGDKPVIFQAGVAFAVMTDTGRPVYISFRFRNELLTSLEQHVNIGLD